MIGLIENNLHLFFWRWRDGDPPRGELFDLDRQDRRQGVERQLKVVQREAAGDAQVGHTRVNAQMPAVVAIEFADHVGQAHVVEHQHAACPGIGPVGDGEHLA